jgi:phenylacetate-CoA ligase
MEAHGPEITTPSAAAHEASLRAAVTHAYEHIPFYKKKRPRTGAPALGGDPLSSALAGIPLLWKHQVRSTLPKEWAPEGRDVRAELESGEIELVETSGSTGERTRILWDKGWWLRQEERGMRTNPVVDRSMANAARYRESILTTPVCGLGACHSGDLSFEERKDEHRLFLNLRADPTFWKPSDSDRMLDELGRHATAGLESDPMYLATLARHAAATGRRIDVTDFVTLTYAMTSEAHLRAIRPVLSAPIFQLYGATEVGVLFMQGEGEGALLHHCPITTHVELLPVKAPTPGAEDVALVVVTTMDKIVQPLLRFVVGDLVRVDRSGPRLFTPVAPIRSAEGRLQDSLIRPDGAWVTAGALDRALGGEAGVAFYQANQVNPASVVIDVVPEQGARATLLAEIKERLAPLLAPLDVTLRLATGIAGEASGKFRLVRRQFTVDLGGLLDAGAGVTG